VTSVPLTIGFDSQALQVVGVTEGGFLKQGGAQTNFSSQVDPGGRISITAGRSGVGGSTSAGAVATLSFRALAPSDAAQVRVLSAVPLGPSGSPVAATLPQPLTLKVSQ
jgi:general secretion pathway protein D